MILKAKPPDFQAIFGEISDSNSTIFIENGSIRNSNRQIGSYSNRNNLKIDTFENLERVVVRDNIGFIEITNNLPKIEVDDDYSVDEALFYNVTDVNDDHKNSRYLKLAIIHFGDENL